MTYDITPNAAAARHASDLAQASTIATTWGGRISSFRRLVAFGIVGGFLLSFLTVAAHAQEKPTVNLNTAIAQELQYLPRVGPATAEIIMQAREEGWKCSGAPTVEVLTQLHRVGEKTAQLWIDNGATCEGPTTATAKIGGKGKSSTGRKYGAPKKEDGEN